MKNNSTTLKAMLIDDLPPEFVTELIQGMVSIYPASFASMYQDRELGEEQAKTILGHYRRALAETLFERTAKKYGLGTELVQPEGGGCTHISIQVGRFRLAMCHVVSQDAFPQHSDNREQSSKANKCIAQINLFPDRVTPQAGEIFGIIIHSEFPGKKDQFDSIKIGFPNCDWDGWIEGPVCLVEISEIQNNQYQEEDLQGIVQNDKAKPKLKRNLAEKKAG